MLGVGKEIRCAEGDKKPIFLFGKMPNLSSRAQKAQTVGYVLAGAFCRLGIMGTQPIFVYFFFARSGSVFLILLGRGGAGNAAGGKECHAWEPPSHVKTVRSGGSRQCWAVSVYNNECTN